MRSKASQAGYLPFPSCLLLVLCLAGGARTLNGQAAPPAQPAQPTKPNEPPPAASAPNALERTTPAPIEKAAQGKTLYSFRADGLDLKTALAVFARANNLNIVPDEDVVGVVTVDV